MIMHYMYITCIAYCIKVNNLETLLAVPANFSLLPIANDLLYPYVCKVECLHIHG